MLGHSAAGKTSYMALMYELMNRGVNGFRVTAATDDDHHQLVRSARAIRAGYYPDATDRRHRYALRLRHQQSPVLDFVWKDFRGDALTEYSTSAQKRELNADLHAADGIVVFVDLPELLTNDRAYRKTRFLNVLVTEALGERTCPTPLVIAATKIDLVAPWMDREPFAAAFTPMVQAVSESLHVHGTVVELSCGSEPGGIPGPVLFCLAHGSSPAPGSCRRRTPRPSNTPRPPSATTPGGNRLPSPGLERAPLGGRIANLPALPKSKGETAPASRGLAQTGDAGFLNKIDNPAPFLKGGPGPQSRIPLSWGPTPGKDFFLWWGFPRVFLAGS